MLRHLSPRLRTGLLSGVALAAAGAIAVACGSDGSNGGDGSGGGGGGGGGDDASLFDDLGTGGDGGGGGGGGGNCTAPIDMYVMQNRSGSMGSDCNIGDTTASKWCRSVNALSGYFNAQGATGNAAALQFFPTVTHNDTLCSTGAQYDTPAAPAGQPYAALPSNAFDALLNSTTLDKQKDGTPTEAAIRGLVKYTAANRRGGRVTIGVLITDGDPNGCDEDLTNLSNLLQANFDATKVWTFVIGMQGATFANLEQIAKGGNTPMHADQVGALTDACGDSAGPCRAWNVGDGNPTAFVAALQAIQALANGCGDSGAYVNPIK